MPPRLTTEPSAVRFGAIIRRLRHKRGWTLAGLARQTKMGSAYLGFIERGYNVPSLSTILRLARVLGVKAAEIIAEVESAEEKVSRKSRRKRSPGSTGASRSAGASDSESG